MNRVIFHGGDDIMNTCILLVVGTWLLIRQAFAEDFQWLAQMPQVADVKFFPKTNADCVLVHLKQSHKKHEFFGNYETEETYEYLDTVHREIFSIGTNFQKRLGLNSYYVEGLTEKFLPRENKRIARERAMYKEELAQFARAQSVRNEIETRYKRMMQETNMALGLRESLQSTGHFVESDFAKDYFFPYGKFPWQAYCERLAIQADMAVRPTETEFLQRRLHNMLVAARALDTAKGTHYLVEMFTGKGFASDFVYTLREDVVLRSIAHDYARGIQTNKIALVIFGGHHSFVDNIECWNTTNAFQFSLIEVTPKSYR